MKTIKVTFSNGDHLTTGINGTEAEILAYYIGQTFNMGVEGDLMVRGVSVDFIEPKSYRIDFTGRRVGAIGIFEKLSAVRQGHNTEEAIRALYNEFEHIANPSATRLS